MLPPRVCTLLLVASVLSAQQALPDGTTLFERHCVLCHSGDGQGTNRGPSVLGFIASNSSDQIAQLIRSGRPDKGMPALDLEDSDIRRLIEHLETLAPEAPSLDEKSVTTFQTADGDSMQGAVLNESGFDAQVRTTDGRIRMLRKSGGSYSEAKREPRVDWPTYHGTYSGNRHSELDQIHRGNVHSLAAEWFFPVPGQRMIEGTPVVIDGVMYVTGVNQVFATGRPNRPEDLGILPATHRRTDGGRSDRLEPRGGCSRRPAVHRDRSRACDRPGPLDRPNWFGMSKWPTTATTTEPIAAPLVVGDLVYFGISGGDTGLRGFLDAYHFETGELAWRFWTIPAPGEPGSETWGDPEILEKGCGATWLTGSYDPELNILYWPTGNPCPDLNGDRRPGDNLYTNSVLALEPETGNLLWHFQFTPHDTHDWDAQEPLLARR